MNKEEILKQASKLNNEILSSKIAKDYFIVKEKIKNDKKLMELEKKVEDYKKVFCKTRNKSDKQKHLELKKELDNHVLVKQYKNLKEEFSVLLEQIATILE